MTTDIHRHPRCPGHAFSNVTLRHLPIRRLGFRSRRGGGGVAVHRIFVVVKLQLAEDGAWQLQVGCSCQVELGGHYLLYSPAEDHSVASPKPLGCKGT